MSLISGSVQRATQPLIEDLYLRGRFENSVVPTNRSRISSIIGVASRISSAAMPARGHPRITRGVSPQASAVVSPVDSRRSKIAGTSSIRIQCSCTFWRSVTSARSRPYVSLAQAIARSWSEVSRPPSMRIRIMKNSSSSSSGSALPVRSPGNALLPLGVQAPPAHPVAEILLADRAEPTGSEDPLDPLPHLERLGLLLDLLRPVQRLVVAQRPLALSTRAGSLSFGECHRRCLPDIWPEMGTAASRRPGAADVWSATAARGVRGRSRPRWSPQDSSRGGRGSSPRLALPFASGSSG